MTIKRILLVSSGGIDRGGVQIFLRDWVECAAKDQYEFTWCVPGAIVDDKLADEFKNAGVKLVLGGGDNGKNLLRRSTRLFDVLKDTLSKEKFDVVHVNTASISTNVVALSLAKRSGIKLRIAHSHNAPQRISLIKRMANAVLRPCLLRNATRLAACSYLAAEYLFGQKSACRAVIVTNCIDTKRFAFSETVREEYRRKLGVQDCFVVGHVGRFNAQKNHAFLLKIFQAVAQRNERARLLLVGDGELRPMIEMQTGEMGLRDRVIFAGVTDIVQDYMCAMDVFVLPSLFEGFPIVGIEAQANGLPCVFSDSITREAEVDDNCVFLPLDKPSEIWAERLLSVTILGMEDRVEAQTKLMEKGYDIAETPGMVNALYMD